MLIDKLAVASTPWDRDRARVWVGTFRRTPNADEVMPAREAITITMEQLDWLRKISRFRDAGLLELEAEGGLVFASLPNRVFGQDPQGAWLALLAAQEMVVLVNIERSPKIRPIPNSALPELPMPELHAMHGRIARSPPPKPLPKTIANR